MEKDKIHRHISICSQMIGIWVNGSTPEVGFQIAVHEMKKTLEDLLELRDTAKGS